MIPTLAGRIQTRIFLLATLGAAWTAWIVFVLPGVGDDLGQTYRNVYIVLATVTVLGVAWEFIYHFLMQFRWEKDWPTLFGLLTGIPEGVLVWVLLQAGAVPGDPDVPGLAYVIMFGSVWLVVWLWSNGPMRVPFLRWRFYGGRVV